MKKIISILLGITILCQIAVVSVYAKNSVPETSVLSELDIISNNIKDETAVTRIELARIIAKMLYNDTPITSDAEGYYIDVPYTKEDAGILSMLSQRGIMSGIGGGKFNPDGTLKIEQCVKVVTVMLGYNILAEDKGGYPQGYMAVASERGILEGVNVTDEDVNYGMLRKILCNVMGAEVMVTKNPGIRPVYEISDETFMENVMGMIKVDGIVKGTNKSALTNSSFCGTEEINIDNNPYLTGENWELDKYVGYYVHAYFSKDEDDRKLFSISMDEKRNNTLVIDVKDIEKFENGKIEYWSDGKKSKKATLDSNADILQSGTPVENYNFDVFDFEDGTVTLIDNNNDNAYEVVKLECTYNTVVAGTNAEKQIIYDMYDSNNTIDLSNVDYTISDAEGNSIHFEDLKKGEVLTWSVSGDGETYSIVAAQDNTITGTVTGISEDSDNGETVIFVDDYDYVVAPSYAQYCKGKIRMGESITLYLDYMERIAGSTNKTNTSSEWKYGFLINSYFHESGDPLYVKLYSEDDTMLYKEVSNRLEIDYIKYKDETAMNNELNTLKNQIVRYKINSNDIITAIDSLKADNTDGSLKRNYQGKNSYMGGVINSFFGHGHLGPNTKVFVVSGENDEFSVKDYTYFGGGEYEISTYITTNPIVCDAVLVLTAEAGKEEKGLIVSIKGTGVDENDEAVGLVDILELNGQHIEKQYEVSLQNMSMEDLKEGQIIKFKCNNSGQIASTELIFDFEQGKKQGFGEVSKETGSTGRLVYGKVGMLEDGQLLLLEDDETSVASSTSEIHNASLYSLYVYDKSLIKDKVRKGTLADIYDYESFGDMCSRIVIYTDIFNPRVMIIYNEE